MKQPEKAKEHLAKLDSICFFGYEEFDELKEDIQDYEKNNWAESISNSKNFKGSVSPAR